MGKISGIGPKTAVAVGMTTIMIAVVWILVLGYLLQSTDRPLKTWKQNDHLNDDFGPFYLTVAEGGWDVGKFPFFDWKRRYYIYVGRDGGKPVYGHVKDYSFSNETEDLRDYLEKCRVKWTADGVFFIERSGHTLFIPKSMYENVR